MMPKSICLKKFSARLAVVLLLLSLTGCMYWLRAYQVYRQLDAFDDHFDVAATDAFTLRFKHPVMYSEDFVSLSGLGPSSNSTWAQGKRWRYDFRKIDAKGEVAKPAVDFYFELEFNRYDRLSAWSFSPLFLKIAPPEFLEISLRSLAGADINKNAKQLKSKAENIGKISARLPKQETVIQRLGAPIEIIPAGEDRAIYLYRFLLDSQAIEKGYEDRALTEVKLTFDTATHELIKMSGRFAGLKITISYRKYLEAPAAVI
ncbi:MAG: hypothetical protein ACU84J_10515 [Gammaproteobacteria bacterium]